jgi:hypothetical protein
MEVARLAPELLLDNKEQRSPTKRLARVAVFSFTKEEWREYAIPLIALSYISNNKALLLRRLP